MMIDRPIHAPIQNAKLPQIVVVDSPKPTPMFGLLDDPAKRIINEQIKQPENTQALLS